jgi:hypothetical protein
MRTFKKCNLIFITFMMVLIMIIGGGFSSGLSASDNQDAQTAAISGLKFWLDAIPKSELEKYGFSKKSELAQVTLGPPFQLYTIHPKKILRYKGEEIADIISAAGERWFFPVLVNGGFRTMLIVARKGSAYKAVGIGYVGLSRQLGTIRAQWPASKGYNIKLVRVYEAFSDFALVEKGGEKPGLVPLESASRALGLKSPKTRIIRISRQQINTPMAVGSVMSKLKAVVEKTLKKKEH